MITKLKDLIIKFNQINKSTKLYFLITILNGIFFSGWILYFNFYILARGFDKTFLGFASSIFPISIVLFSLPMGIVFDKIGGRKSMMIGQFGFLIGTFFVVLSKTKLLIIASFFLAGVGDSLYIVSLSPMLSKLAGKKNREAAFAFNAGLLTFAMVVGSYLAGQMPSWLMKYFSIVPKTLLSYQWIMMAGILLSYLIYIPLYKIKEPMNKDSVEDSLESESIAVRLKDILKDKELLQYFLPYLFIGIGSALVVPYLNIFFVEKFSISEIELGNIFSLGAFVAAIFIFLGPWLSKKLKSPIWAVLWMQGGSILFLILLGFSSIWGVVIVGFLLRRGLLDAGVPIFESFAMDQVEESRHGKLSSMLVLGVEGGFAIGAIFSGLIQDFFGFVPVIILSIVFYSAYIFSIWNNFATNQRNIKSQIISQETNLGQ